MGLLLETLRNSLAFCTNVHLEGTMSSCCACFDRDSWALLPFCLLQGPYCQQGLVDRRTSASHWLGQGQHM